jgi:hypothetical protein
MQHVRFIESVVNPDLAESENFFACLGPWSAIKLWIRIWLRSERQSRTGKNRFSSTLIESHQRS